ncbi:triose-phosphate isomerase [soil metagenome]
MTIPLIAGNWKMNRTHLEAISLAQQLGYELDGHHFDRVEVAVCPPFTALRTLQTLIDGDRLGFKLGAQDVYPEKEGAFTGEVSPVMLEALDVDYVITGHSERRQILGESDEMVAAKVKATLAHSMTPILCCGETDEEREAGETERKVERQVRAGLQGVTAEQAATVVIAYEPIWAIGTGKTATPEDAQATTSFIRGVVAGDYGPTGAESIRILYGGSVKSGNANALLSQADVDGALVGGASLDAREFAAIVKAV